MAAACTFVHVGDTHLHPGQRNPDRLRALDQIINENITRTDLAAWLWPGDVFHARSGIDDRNALAQRMQLMASRAPICLVYGNHDLPGDLDVFGKLAAVWPIYVVARPCVLDVQTATGHMAAIFCLPYPTEAGLVSQGVAPGEVVQTARQALDAIFIDAAARLDEARARGDITLMIGHVNVAGAMTSVGQPNIGQEIEIDGALLARLGENCYKGLNHIHKAQLIAGANYPGSICRLDWGEIEPKGYLRITYARDDIGWARAPIEWCPIDVARMYHVEGLLTRDGFTYEVKAGPDGAVLEKPASWKGCEVRVRARYQHSEKAMLEFAKANIFAEFAEASRFDLELIATPDGALRAPAVAAARTLAEKVEAWAAETKTVLPAAALAVLPALEHGDPETVIAAERDAMDALLDAHEPAEERQVAVA